MACNLMRPLSSRGHEASHSAWDVTVPDTFAQSHLPNTAIRSCAAADTVASNKTTNRHISWTPKLLSPLQWRLVNLGIFRLSSLFKILEGEFQRSLMNQWRHSICFNAYGGPNISTFFGQGVLSCSDKNGPLLLAWKTKTSCTKRMPRTRILRFFLIA
jgi:hypothetical protein